MKRRFLATILITTLTASLLIGCGNKTASPSATIPDNPPAEASSQNAETDDVSGTVESKADETDEVPVESTKNTYPDVAKDDALSVTDESVHVATAEEITLLEEAITIFPIYDKYMGPEDLKNEGHGVLERWAAYTDQRPNYAGLTFEKGQAPLTLDHLDYENIDKGATAYYTRCSKEDLQKAMQGFYDTYTTIRIIEGYDYCVDDNYVTLWGNGYIVSYEGFMHEWTSFSSEMDGSNLIITGDRSSDSLFETRYDTIEFTFEYNPKSFYNYSLVGFEKTASDFSLSYTLDQVKDYEDYIRHYVNEVATEDDIAYIDAGVDGIPYAREYVYNAGTLMFAYYYNSTKGKPDNRYYFECGRMIEWIEGSGNDDTNRVRHYSCDDPLDSRWKSTEEMVVEDADKYR